MCGVSMLKIYNLKDKQDYIKEVVTLTQKEWGKSNLKEDELVKKISNKVEKIKGLFNENYYCKLILLDDNNLVGFISIFPSDGDERKDLSPWYATMYVKEKYRGKGYSKILNDAILQEAKKRKINKIYLKTELENYYEKFGAKYLEDLNEKEKIYYFDLK
jgi:GNAT superfamily N-acetyltransferase